MTHGIKRGQFVEFTDRPYRNYPPADTSVIRYGVAVENEIEGSPVLVRLANGEEVRALYVYASGWAGWAPEGLEAIQGELDPSPCDWDDDRIYEEGN